jgi:hypothetical protein
MTDEVAKSGTEEVEKSGSWALPIAIGPLKFNLEISNIAVLRAVWEKYSLPIARRLAPLLGNEIDIVMQKQLLRKLSNIERIENQSNKILTARNVTPDEVSPSISDPLVESAVDEERPELQALWAKLLAAAKDPNRRVFVRRSIIDAVKALEPNDALIFQSFSQQPTNQGQNLRNVLMDRLRLEGDDVQVSIDALVKLGLIGSANQTTWYIAPLGRLLVRAIAD